MMNKYRLESILFISGAVVMILELVGSRIVAPFLGTSIYVWTSLIGIILGSLSVGYWWGGRMADRKPDYKTFSWMLFMSAVFIGCIYLVKQYVLTVIQNVIPDIRLGAVVAAVVLFAPASIMLGTISPYAVRLRIEDIGSSGSTVGRLYAISTMGSIVGTFSAGFFLIAYLGSGEILIVLAITMLAVSLLAGLGRKNAKKQVFFAGTGVLLVAVLLAHSLFIRNASERELDTLYSHVIVEERMEEATGKHIRFLRVDQKWAQSAVYVNHPNDLFFDYNKFYRLAEHFVPRQTSALLIGGGTYTFARDYLARNPKSRMDVVEIDPQLTELAQMYFFLTDDARLKSFHEDGRAFLDRSDHTYDVIYVDVFKASASPPFHLMTEEAVGAMASSLKDVGVVCTNIYSAIEGEKGQFFRAAYATFKNVFHTVLVFPVQHPLDGKKLQNIILVAMQQSPGLDSADAELNRYLSHRWQRPIPSDMPVLTDDFAPVEHLLIAVIKAFSSETH